MLSYWEKNSLIATDFIIIGSGFVGLHLAIQLQQKFPNKTIRILERGLLPFGASTKNAGFGCTGSLSELLDDLKTQTESEVLQLFKMRKDGLAYSRQLLGDNNIGFRNEGSYELLTPNLISSLDELENINSLLRPILDQNAFEHNNKIIKNSQFNPDYFKAAITNTCEASLNTGFLVQNLLKYAQQLGISIITGCEVKHVEEKANHIQVHGVAQHQSLNFKAEKIFYCNNAFAKTLLPQIDIKPGRGIVLATKAISTLPFKGIYHFSEGYYYFRTINDVVLFGGGRQLAKTEETTAEFGLNEVIIADLKQKLLQYILPNTPHQVDYFWSGIMAFGNGKFPIIQQLSERSYCAIRCGGMGLAIAPIVAKQLVGMIE